MAGCAPVISPAVLKEVDQSVRFEQVLKVTVVGSVFGKEVRPLGEIEYTYPIITKRELYIWPAEEPSATQPRVRFGVGIGIGL
jgi:outer membrane lipoprotein